MPAARCPSCNQVYTDETLSFCPNDGTPLVKDAPSSSYDPQATLIAQPPQPYQPQQQDYYAPQGGQAPPPQGWQQPPYGQQQQQFPPQYGAPPVTGGKNNKLPLIIALAAIVLIGGGIGLYFLLRDNSSSRNFNNNSATSNTHTTSTSSTSTSTSSSTSTEDDKYRLFYAAAKTGDPQLSKDIGKEIGILDANGMPTAYYETFVKGAYAWAARDYKWVQDHTTVEQAREWLAAHR